MKRLLIVVLTVVMLFGYSAVSIADVKAVTGVKVDAPKLVKLMDDLFLGVEVGKDVQTNSFFFENRKWIEDDKGFFGYAKITYTGTLFNLGGE